MTAERKKYLKVAALSVLVSLLAGAVVILILGKNPLSAYYNLLQGVGLAPKAKYGGGQSMLTDLSSYIDYWTPMIFAALSYAVAMRCGLFNIGISGQMLIGGFTATVLVGYSNLPSVAAKPLVILVGLVAGMAGGALIGFLKYRFNVNEVVSSIMINYIAEYVISFIIQTSCIDPVSRQSRAISNNARLTFHQVLIGGYKYDLPIGFLLAIAVMLLVKFVFIHVGSRIVLSMAISGALAGLAGVTYYLGYVNSIQPRVLLSTGYDAIAVGLLGNNDPVGIFFASFLIEIISKGSTYLQSQAGLESEIADVITGLILLTSACNFYFMARMGRKEKQHAERN